MPAESSLTGNAKNGLGDLGKGPVAHHGHAYFRAQKGLGHLPKGLFEFKSCILRRHVQLQFLHPGHEVNQLDPAQQQIQFYSLQGVLLDVQGKIGSLKGPAYRIEDCDLGYFVVQIEQRETKPGTTAPLMKAVLNP